MKRFLILFMILGLVASSMATAEAKTKKTTRVERTVTGNYGPYPSPVTGCNEVVGLYACLVIDTRSWESSLTAKVTDLHGQPVFVEVGTSGGATDEAFCGETTRPITFAPGSTVYFYLGFPGWPGNLMLDCPANRIKTTGTISVTLSGLVPVRSEPTQVQPLRSGSVLSGTGWILDGEMGGCQMSPDCRAWLENDCDQALQGWDPGLTASIVDVDKLADGPPKERLFRFGAGDPWSPVFGGVHLQFWSSDCVELSGTRWRYTDDACPTDGSGRNCRILRLRIPRSAKWMTVTSYQDNVNLVWTLS